MSVVGTKLSHLAMHGGENNLEYFKSLLAKKSHLSQEQIKIFSFDKNPWVRAGVAENPSTPIDILERLSKSNNAVVISGVLQSPNLNKLPNHIVEKLLSILYYTKLSDF